MDCSGSKFKAIIHSDRPGKKLAELNEQKYYDCLEELYNLKEVSQPEDGHPEGDAWRHSLLVVNKAAQLTLSAMVRYAALLHDFGKQATPLKARPHHYDHEKKADTYIIRLSRRLGVLPAWEKAALTAARLHMKGHYFPKLRPGTKVDLLVDINNSPLSFEQFCQILLADAHGRGRAAYEPIYLKDLINYGNKMFEIYPENSDIDAQKLRVDRCNWMAGNL
ncbi:HD domain-containing protein [Halarsenatibacter silvermanii]|uniref:HD domain-containing protein n=1 Tax=Halarsenatibacter silvermanii TaxID=321763 RepID=A0A1G9P6W1_9FIRM|nr:HD domain-containing protein [Halarsenatibacter silvermanii]SDL93895.1 HD domain-containing protein [Halarsenatibacter silvermanii]